MDYKIIRDVISWSLGKEFGLITSRLTVFYTKRYVLFISIGRVQISLHKGEMSFNKMIPFLSRFPSFLIFEVYKFLSS